MASAKDGSDTVTIRDYQGLPLDVVHSDGNPTHDYSIMGSPTPPVQLAGSNDSFAAMYIALQDMQADNKRLQQQLYAERAKKQQSAQPQQPAQLLQQQQLAASSAAAASTTSGSGPLWQCRQHAAHEASSSPPGAAAGPPTGRHLQQRSASSPAVAAEVATIVGLDIGGGESAAPSSGRLRELEEASRRWAAAEEAYRQQIHGLKVRIEELHSESERLKKALTAARSAAARAAPSQPQDPDSGFTTTQGGGGLHPVSSSSSATSSPATSLADRRWSSLEDSYKRQIQELAGELARIRAEHAAKTEQLQHYADELEVLYADNERLKRKLSAQATAAPAVSQLYPDSGLASQGLHTSSSTTNSSQELSMDAMQTIRVKVQKSREAVAELKDVVQRQTEVIKNFKELFDKKCKKQGESAGGGADAHLAFEASTPPAAAPQQRQRDDSWQQLSQSHRAPTRRQGGGGLPPPPAAAAAPVASFAAVSAACFSYAPSSGHVPRVDRSAGQPQPSAQVGVRRQAVEQSDQLASRSLSLMTTGCGSGDDMLDNGWVRDAEHDSGTMQSMLLPSARADSYDDSGPLPTAAEERTIGGGAVEPAASSSWPRPAVAAAAAAYGPMPGAAGAPAAPGREHRICPVCNARFPSLEPLERLQEHILDCEGTSLPAVQQQQQQEPASSQLAGGGSPAAEARLDERSCPMCNAHFPPELPQREYELHVMSHFEEDYVVAGRELWPPGTK